MANRLKGEVEIKAGDKTYVLRLSINAIVEIEGLLGLSINEVAASLADPERVKVGTLRAIVWGGLRQHHPALTLAEAGEIIGEAGIAQIGDVIGQAFNVAFPGPETSAANPQ